METEFKTPKKTLKPTLKVQRTVVKATYRRKSCPVPVITANKFISQVLDGAYTSTPLELKKKLCPLPRTSKYKQARGVYVPAKMRKLPGTPHPLKTKKEFSPLPGPSKLKQARSRIPVPEKKKKLPVECTPHPSKTKKIFSPLPGPSKLLISKLKHERCGTPVPEKMKKLPSECTPHPSKTKKIFSPLPGPSKLQISKLKQARSGIPVPERMKKRPGTTQAQLQAPQLETRAWTAEEMVSPMNIKQNEIPLPACPMKRKPQPFRYRSDISSLSTKLKF